MTVCNACGIKWKTQTTRQAMNAEAVAKGEEPRFGEDGKGVVKRKDRDRQESVAGGAGVIGEGGQMPVYGVFMPPELHYPQHPPSGGLVASQVHPLYPHPNTLPPLKPPHGYPPLSPNITATIPHQTSYPLSQPPPSSARPPLHLSPPESQVTDASLSQSSLSPLSEPVPSQSPPSPDMGGQAAPTPPPPPPPADASVPKAEQSPVPPQEPVASATAAGEP